MTRTFPNEILNQLRSWAAEDLTLALSGGGTFLLCGVQVQEWALPIIKSQNWYFELEFHSSISALNQTQRTVKAIAFGSAPGAMLGLALSM